MLMVFDLAAITSIPTLTAAISQPVFPLARVSLAILFLVNPSCYN